MMRPTSDTATIEKRSDAPLTRACIAPYKPELFIRSMEARKPMVHLVTARVSALFSSRLSPCWSRMRGILSSDVFARRPAGNQNHSLTQHTSIFDPPRRLPPTVTGRPRRRSPRRRRCSSGVWPWMNDIPTHRRLMNTDEKCVSNC